MIELIEHPLGVHLNQRHEDYLQDHGLGYGAIKDVFLSPTEWWDASVHNALREVEDSEENKRAYLRGAALHTFVLDGERVYNKAYGVRPSKASHPEALDSVAQLVALCDRFGITTRGATKPMLVDRLVKARKLQPDIAKWELLPELQEKFDLFSGKKNISERDDIRIRILHRMMMRDRAALKIADDEAIILKDALHNALTEVSVYWVDADGVRQRARFDILKPNMTGDLKSITRWKKSNFKGELLKEVILRGYMIQAAHYHEARVELRKAVVEGRVFGGNKTQRKLLERIARSDYWAWVFIFAKMDGAAQVKGIVIRQESGQFIKAQQQREEALANFIYYREFHGGLETPWFDPEVVWEPAEDEWPLFSVLGQ